MKRRAALCCCLFIFASVAIADEPPAPTKARESLLACAQKHWPGLELDLKLCDAAQEWADHLAENNLFCHDKGCRENIARGQRTPCQVIRDWKKSRGHANNFRRSSRVGFGVARNPRGRLIWVSRLK